MNIDIRSELCEAIDTIVQRRLDEQRNDYTISAEIVECLDESLGSYRVKYQESYFTAYASDNTFIYAPGSQVSITISSGDFSNVKKINPGVSEATSYLPIINLYNQLEAISDSCLDNNIEYILETNNQSDSTLEKIIYDNTYATNQNINFSLQNGKYLILEGNILGDNLSSVEGQIDFGFKIEINIFKNLKVGDILNEDYLIKKYNPTEELEDKVYYYEPKSFYLKVADMDGNPFAYNGKTFIYKCFNIENERIYNLNKITIFMDNKISNNYNISFSDLKCYVAKKNAQEDLSNYIFKLKTNNIFPYYSYNMDNAEGEIMVSAELLIKGRKVDFEKQTQESTLFYWFIEDASINIGDEYYSPYGGVGWKCLNNKINYGSTFSFANGKYYIKYPKKQLSIKDRFKCIIHYGEERKIIETAYFTAENTYYRESYLDKGIYPAYCLKCYNDDYFFTEENRRTSFYIDNSNLQQKYYLKAITPVNKDYNYYWTKSDVNGLFTYIDNNSNVLEINSSDISGYSYYTCTVKDKDKIIFNDNIKITNEINKILGNSNSSHSHLNKSILDDVTCSIEEDDSQESLKLVLLKSNYDNVNNNNLPITSIQIGTEIYNIGVKQNEEDENTSFTGYEYTVSVEGETLIIE